MSRFFAPEMVFAISLLLALLWMGQVACSVSIPRGLQESVADGGKPGNPGFKIRVTQAGVDYVESLANKALQDQFPRIRISDVKADTQNGDIYLTNMQITKFKSPEKHLASLEPPDTIRWSISDADLSLHGNYLSHQQQLLSKSTAVGDFDADAKGVDFTVSFMLTKTDDGGLSVKSRQCSANIKSLTATVKNKTPTLGAALAALFKNSIVNKMRPLVAAQMCQEARKFIDLELNKQLSTMSKKLPLNQTSYNFKQAQRDDRTNKITADTDDDNSALVTTTLASLRSTTSRNKTNGLRKLANNISKQLILDYSHIKDPSVSSKYLESFNRGEISYEGQGGTPFYPTDLQEPTPIPIDRMVNLIASDFLLNTLFWHAFKHGLLTFRANRQTNPEYAYMLRTSCDEDVFAVCIGNIVPEVGKTFPKSEVELVFQAVKAPAIYFQKDGRIKLVAPSYISGYAKKGNEFAEMLTADLYVESQMRVWIEDMYLRGNGTITKFNMTMKRNNLQNFNQEKLDEFASMARAMFQELSNTELMKGLPLPTMQGASLVKPILHVYERTVRIETDMTIDEEVLTLLAADAFRDSNSTSKVPADDGQPSRRI